MPSQMPWNESSSLGFSSSNGYLWVIYKINVGASMVKAAEAKKHPLLIVKANSTFKYAKLIQCSHYFSSCLLTCPLKSSDLLQDRTDWASSKVYQKLYFSRDGKTKTYSSEIDSSENYKLLLYIYVSI